MSDEKMEIVKRFAVLREEDFLDLSEGIIHDSQAAAVEEARGHIDAGDIGPWVVVWVGCIARSGMVVDNG
jgi:hypothetical protein